MEKQNENEAEIKKKIKIEKNNKIMQKKKKPSLYGGDEMNASKVI